MMPVYSNSDMGSMVAPKKPCLRISDPNQHYRIVLAGIPAREETTADEINAFLRQSEVMPDHYRRATEVLKAVASNRKGVI